MLHYQSVVHKTVGRLSEVDGNVSDLGRLKAAATRKQNPPLLTKHIYDLHGLNLRMLKIPAFLHH